MPLLGDANNLGKANLEEAKAQTSVLQGCKASLDALLSLPWHEKPAMQMDADGVFSPALPCLRPGGAGHFLSATGHQQLQLLQLDSSGTLGLAMRMKLTAATVLQVGATSGSGAAKGKAKKQGAPDGFVRPAVLGKRCMLSAMQLLHLL